MKRLTYALLLLLAATGAAHAATPDQMEQARAIVAKQCLRYMNNGSGYLDDKGNPKSMAELEGYLKPKEKENLAKIKSISMPPESEYSKWDKGQFDKYWTVTFFDKTPKFDAKSACRSRAAKGVSAIKVTAQAAPTAPEEKKPEEAKPEETKPEEPKTPEITQPVSDEELASALPDEQVAPAPVNELPTEPVDPEKGKKKSSGNTGAIIVLILLVIVVVALVAYALNVMKKNKARTEPSARRAREQEDEERPARRAPRRESTARRDEDYAPRRREPVQEEPRTVQSDPYEESAFAAYSDYTAPEPEPAPVVRSTPRQAPKPKPAPKPAAPAPAADPRDAEIARLKAEIAALRGDAPQTGRQDDGYPLPRQRASRQQSAGEVPVTSGYTPNPARRTGARVIYLAQANADGVFTRADAHYSQGNSIFKMVTTDGVSGSFSVIEDPTVFDIALMMPQDFLVNAATGPNLLNTQSALSIVNEAAGTAIFEGGRWRVARKAQIRYSR